MPEIPNTLELQQQLGNRDLCNQDITVSVIYKSEKLSRYYVQMSDWKSLQLMQLLVIMKNLAYQLVWQELVQETKQVEVL